MMDKGFVKLYRKIKKWNWYHDNNVLKIFIHCLCTANFTAQNYGTQEVPAGAFLTTLDMLAIEVNMTKRQVRTALDKLKVTQEVVTQKTNRNLIISINNWENYQGDVTQKAHKRHANDTQMTRRRHTDDTQNSENGHYEDLYDPLKNVKNDKNVKNIEKDISTNVDISKKKKSEKKVFKKPTLEEIEKYCAERKSYVDPKTFYEYFNPDWIDSKGNKVKNWKQKIITWEKFNTNPKNGKSDTWNSTEFYSEE